MQATKNRILFIVILFFAFKANSQVKNDTIKKNMPVSIYNVSQQTLTLTSKYSINQMLHLTSFKFVTLDMSNIENGFFSVSFDNLKRKPSAYIYDSYQTIYQNKALTSTFFYGYDLKNPSIFPR